MYKVNLRPASSPRLFTSRSLNFAIALVLLALVHFCFWPLGSTKGRRISLGWQLNPVDVNLTQSSTGRVLPDDCAGLSGLDRVVITVKTGATEALERIPVHLRTTLRCAPNVYIFSDMAQKIGDIEIHDALDEFPVELTRDNPDFELYRRQQILREIAPETIPEVFRDFKHPNKDELAAWTLDKYKNFHIVERSWKMKPDMDWYLHIDADTYVVLPSLLEWIHRLDHTLPLFMGSVAYVGNDPFLHGGSGILVSNAATRTFTVTNNGTAARWIDKIEPWCCGDFVLAQAFKEYGIQVMDTWPSINGDSPDTVAYGERHWCQPLVTLHHVDVAGLESVSAFEQNRTNKHEPLRYQELFHDYIFDQLPDERSDWDNQSNDQIISGVPNNDECKRLCLEQANCLQARFSRDQCIMGTTKFRLGKQVDTSAEDRWQSTWHKGRMIEWSEKTGKCKNITFPFQT